MNCAPGKDAGRQEQMDVDDDQVFALITRKLKALPDLLKRLGPQNAPHSTR